MSALGNQHNIPERLKSVKIKRKFRGHFSFSKFQLPACMALSLSLEQKAIFTFVRICLPLETVKTRGKEIRKGKEVLGYNCQDLWQCCKVN